MSDRKADLRKALKSLYDDLLEAENGPDRNTFGFKHRLKVIHENLEEMMPRLLAEFPHLGEFSTFGDFEQEHSRRGDSGTDQLLKSEIKKLAIETDTDLESGIKQIKLKGIDNVYEGKSPSNQSNDIVKILSLIDTKLRKTIRNEPKKEKEVTDALENLFIGADLDEEFTREKETITYSSKAYIPDFVFKKISTIVETKLCTSSTKEKEIISEINDDIVAYKTQYSNIIFVVYDLGIIRDQDKFRDSLEANENVIIKVIKH